MNFVNVTIRMDENVKKQCEQVLNELGMNMSTAVNIYFRAIARQRKIPFELALTDVDLFSNAENKTSPGASKGHDE